MKSTISLPSVTFAMKAQDKLRENGIESATVRLRPGQSPRGCGWGLELDALYLERADKLLTMAAIQHGVLRGGT